ncbi:Nn.00g085090.m01.CDS01 [Neocucurbitaria sp. VM-36]
MTDTPKHDGGAYTGDHPSPPHGNAERYTFRRDLAVKYPAQIEKPLNYDDSSPEPVYKDFHPCNRSNCSLTSPCVPVKSMTTNERRFHVYYPLAKRNFEDGQIVNFPSLVMCGSGPEDGMRTEYGIMVAKNRYGIVIERTVTGLGVIALGTSHGHGPMNKPDEKRAKCFGLANKDEPYRCKDDMGNLVPFQPELGVFTIPRDINYKAKPGVYGDISEITNLPYDSRITLHGWLEQNVLNRILELRVEKILQRAISSIPLESARAILEAGLKLVGELTKEKEDQEERHHQDKEPSNRAREERKPSQNRHRQDLRPHQRRPLQQRDQNRGLKRAAPSNLMSLDTVGSRKRANTMRSSDAGCLSGRPSQYVIPHVHRNPSSRDFRDSGYESRPRHPPQGYDSYRPKHLSKNNGEG